MWTVKFKTSSAFKFQLYTEKKKKKTEQKQDSGLVVVPEWTQMGEDVIKRSANRAFLKRALTQHCWTKM